MPRRVSFWSLSLALLALGCAEAPKPPVANQPQPNTAPPATPQANPGQQAAQAQGGGFIGGLMTAMSGQQPGSAPQGGAPASAPPNANPMNPSLQPNNARPGAMEAGADQYGETGGEQTVPATTVDAPLRARKGDKFYTLSNPRTGNSRFGRPTISVDYKTLRKTGEFGGGTLLIRGGDGNTSRVMLLGLFGDADTIEVENRFGGPFGKPLPQNAELYMVRGESRYGVNPMPNFKVSNSVVMGTMPNPSVTLARNWTAAEAAAFSQPFKAHLNPNANMHLGKDTEIAGDAKGGAPQRFVDKDKPLLGLEYAAGEWEKEKCLRQIVAVYDQDQAPSPGLSRASARAGYAVGGVNVRTGKFVNSIQLVYMKTKPDGSLDSKESYTSDWLGTENKGDKETKLGQTGKRVMGLKTQQGAVINGLALVMEP